MLRGRVVTTELLGSEVLAHVEVEAAPVVTQEVLEVAGDTDRALAEDLRSEARRSAGRPSSAASRSRRACGPATRRSWRSTTDKLQFFDLETETARCAADERSAVMTETIDATRTDRPLLIGGKPVSGGQTEPVIFPYDGSEIGRVAVADEAIVEQALETAAGAAEETAALPPWRRAEILLAAAQLTHERREELARQMTLETGLAVWESRLEADRTVEIFRFAGEEARRFSALGELVAIDAVPRGEGRHGRTRRFPVGPVLGITAFNGPLLLVAHKLAPALAAGNPCIVRPAPKTPLSALSVAEILLEAGAPPAAVSVVPSSNELAERMVRDERIKMLTFTGSARVGWYLKGIAATPNVTLELGGNGAVIVHEDANVDYAAERCSFGGFLRSGQACISVQRLYAHTSIVERADREAGRARAEL